MAGSVNKVIIIGNLGKDPEVRSMQTGDRVANLSIATSETWKDRATGESKEKTEWHRVTIFAEHAIGVVERFVKKGDRVYIEGSLQTRKWTDQHGAEKYSTEIVVGKFNGQIVLMGGGAAGGSDSEHRAPAQARTSPRGGNPVIED